MNPAPETWFFFWHSARSEEFNTMAHEGVKARSACRSGTRERFVRARAEKLTFSATVGNLRARPRPRDGAALSPSTTG
jgi:hypothetical protein